MTPSDLDEIRKRCEAVGSVLVTDVCRDRQALLDEVERLQRERDAAWRQHDFVTEREKQLVANLERVDSRLALLEPVWEAAKEWHETGGENCDAGGYKGVQRKDCPRCKLLDAIVEADNAIDAAVAKEGK